MVNTIVSIKATLHVCHSLLTKKDTITWEHKPEQEFSSKEDFQNWVKELSKNSYEEGTYISFSVLHETGNKFHKKASTCKYADWNQLLTL